MKVCSRCRVEQDEAQFYVKTGYKDGMGSFCKSCHKKITNTWRRNNPDKVRASRIRHKFRLSVDTFDEMFEAQNGVCAICKQPEKMIRAGQIVSLSIDHNRACCPGDRSCGSCVRGLLCYACNTGIARFNDNPELLLRAIDYITSNNKKGNK